MIQNEKVLALIPARGGSKGIKNKNIISLVGKPLLAYTIEAAQQSQYIDSVVLSTDSDHIAQIGRQYGAETPFIRPAYLATDSAKTVDVVVHAIETLKERGDEYQILVLLQPTQPLRQPEDIDQALKFFLQHGEEGLVSVTESEESPILTRTLENGRLKPFLAGGSTVRRQDMPVFYYVNGCIYINKVSEINENTSFNDNPRPFIMDISHSVDIDDPKDLELAEYYLNRLK